MSFLVKPKLGLQFALQFYAERKSGRSSNQLGWGLTPEFFHLRLCLCSLALSIAAIVLADLLATSSLLGNQDITNNKWNVLHLLALEHMPVFFVFAFVPFANVTELNAFPCLLYPQVIRERIHCFCQVCGQVFVVIFQADGHMRNIFVAAGHPV